jgi:predicted site-specific integrase-resolvase
LAKLRPEWFRAADTANRRTIAYARVSSHDQKDDLERQKQERMNSMKSEQLKQPERDDNSPGMSR